MRAVEEAEDVRRLRWQCRRGLLELDILFTRFLGRHYRGLSAPERSAFRKLLAAPDAVLLAWVQGQQTPPKELKDIIDIITQ